MLSSYIVIVMFANYELFCKSKNYLEIYQTV